MLVSTVNHLRGQGCGLLRTESLGELVELLEFPHQRNHGGPGVILQELIAWVLDGLATHRTDGTGHL